MTLGRLFELVPPAKLIASSSASWKSAVVSILAFDSRQAGPEAVFFALDGLHTDGHRFLGDAAARGCRAVVVSQVPTPVRGDTVYAVVDNPRFALSAYAAAFYGNPSRELITLGVTGTDGKSSTVSFIDQLLRLAGERAGFFSTVEWSDGLTVHHNEGRQSTPEAPQVHEILRQMVGAGCRFAVLEATSHGLSPRTNRLGDVSWSGAVFTNVTTEHLEFHGTVDVYRRDKARLFEALSRGPEHSFAVVNADDPYADLFIAASRPRRVFTYSLVASTADLFVSALRERSDGLSLTFAAPQGRSPEVRLPIPGRFNASNAAAALLAASTALTLSGRSASVLDLVPLLSQLHPIKGRMVTVDEGQPFTVLVDYAHTPGAFEALLPAVRKVTEGRLIAVFGSGGERDRQKRPLQGQLADQWADFVVLTDEDPRGESSRAIIDDIAQGIQNKIEGQSYWKITPREDALRQAFALARAGDTVLLLGKGHEQSIVTAEGAQPWDEERSARRLLQQRTGAHR